MPKTDTRGAVIRGLRKERGWTQSELARRVGVETQAVSMWENDKVRISDENLRGLVGVFGVKPDVLGYEVPSAVTVATPPAWFVQYMEQQAKQLSDIERKLDQIIARRR